MRSTSRCLLRAAALAIVALSLVLPAPAQSVPIKFDPTRDLEGFEDCLRSEFKDLYPIARYDKLLGKEMSAADVEKLKETWKSEVQQALKAIAALRADPMGVYVHHLHRKLATDAYFSKIAWTEDRSAPPFVFVIQKPNKEDPEYAQRVIGLYRPWVTKLEHIFSALYVHVLGLKRRPEPAGYTVCILASPGDHSDYVRLASTDFVHVGSDVELAVGYEDPFDNGGSPTRRRFPVLSRTARLILESYTDPDAELSLWIECGMPGYLAYHEGLLPETLDRRRIDDEGVALIVAALQKREKRAVLLHPVEDLVDVDDQETLVALVLKRAAEARVKEPPWNELIQAVQIQSVLWMHFLQDAEDGKYRARFLKYLASELAGDGGSSAFKEAFQGVDLAALNREFYAFVMKERERANPSQKLDRALLEKLFADRASKPGSTPGAEATASATPAAPRIDPRTLAVGALDWPAQHGLALLRVQRGDLEGARQMLQDLAAQKPPAAEAARIGREIERVEELVRLRDGFLAGAIQDGTKWKFEHEGKKIEAMVVRVDAGRVILAENKAGVASIPLAELAPNEIAPLAATKAKQGDAAPWARAYAYIVCGDARWEKLAKDSSPAARELYQDARAVYPELSRIGEAAGAIDALSTSSWPSTRAEGEALLASIRALLARSSDLALVKARREGLRSLATAAAEQVYGADEPAAMLQGKLTKLDKDAVRIVYDFEQLEQLGDFKTQAGYLKEWSQAMVAVKRNEADSSFAIEDGVLLGKGNICLRHKLELAAPSAVRVAFRWQNVPVEDASPSVVMVGMCDDGKGSCIASDGAGQIVADDRKSSFSKRSVDASAGTYAIGQTYRLEVQHDGAKVTTFVDDVQRHSASCGPLKSGGVFVWLHADYPLVVDRLEIEGTPDAASLARLRSDWIAKKVAELGFK